MKWMQEEDEIVLKMSREGFGLREISDRIERTMASVKARIRWLAMTPEEQREHNTRRRDFAPSKAKNIIRPKIIREEIPESVFREAIPRASEPRSLTAWMFGDPPPSHSQLARRQSGA